MIKEFSIGNRKIGDDYPVFIIGEIGICHNGDIEIAKKLIKIIADSGANCAKFQMRDLNILYNDSINKNNYKENLSTQYTIDLLKKFELTKEEMYECFDLCKELKIIPLCTPWDVNSLNILEEYGMEAYKISSADFTNHELLYRVIQTGKPLICSTGMSYQNEIIKSIELLDKYNASYSLLHCNSTYPPHMRDLNLNYINKLKSLGDCVVGYSGHERGIHIPIVAVALGAKIIEKHITLDKTMEGNDHKISLLPDEFKKMVDQIKETEMALGIDNDRIPSQGELMNRINLAKSLIINCNLDKDDIIIEEMIKVKSPGRGLQPIYKDKLIGRLAKRNFKKGDYFFPEDIDLNQIDKSRNYSFKRKWGIPVRYHDFKTLLSKSNPDFLEFHLSYKDMEIDHNKFFDVSYNLDFTVHSPDTFSGDHLLNLASTDDKYRERSINELQKVIYLTRELKQYFIKSVEPLIIVSVGGFSDDRFFTYNEKQEAYKLVADSLSKLDKKGIKIIPQTLPPFPWYFGGQLYCNLFVHPEDTAQFCKTYRYNICLDVSHSKLASNYYKIDFGEFVKKTAPYSVHSHLVDAKGLDSEGLQIDEGEINFNDLSKQLDVLSPYASFIPEIWMGHENEGHKQWVALERLEKYKF